ncbi:MAG: hypothetical protein H6Q78_1685, partial [Candidatus Krumholzibacteriota bacterium]|nr:hypothetical protein [Candidatus Krumholzibacteriota bacterium]
MRKVVVLVASAFVIVSLSSFTAACAARIASIASCLQASEDDTVPAVSKEPPAQRSTAPAKKARATGLLGTWQCRMQGGASTLVFESESRLNLDGQPARYSVVGNALRVQDESGTQDYPFTLEKNTLTIGFAEGYELQFTKTSDKTVYDGEDAVSETDSERDGYGDGQTAGEPPAGVVSGGQALEGEAPGGG